MLADRPYMRSPTYSSGWSITTILLVVNLAVFVLHSVLEFYEILPVSRYFALSVLGLSRGFIWQLISYQFLHGGLLHLLCNLLVIFFFGRPVEAALGTSRFLKLYLTSGVIGGLIQILFALAAPAYFGGMVVGASASAYGLVAAFAVINWERQFTLLLYFFPITMRGKTLFWVSAGLAFFGIIVPTSSVAHAAHLGGILTGWFLIRRFLDGKHLFPVIGSIRFATKPRREMVGAPTRRRSAWGRSSTREENDLPSEEFISREVDPILDKISAHGIQSLTEQERKILEAARARMARR